MVQIRVNHLYNVGHGNTMPNAVKSVKEKWFSDELWGRGVALCLPS